MKFWFGCLSKISYDKKKKMVYDIKNYVFFINNNGIVLFISV